MNANVLIVDDCCEDVEIFERLIRDETPKTNIYKADSIANAYRASMEHDIDLFVINGTMDQGRDGGLPALRFASAMRGMERYYITPMLVKMGLDNQVDYLLQVLHVYACIEKPFDENRVRELMKKTIGLKNLPSRGEMSEVVFREGGMLHVVRPMEIRYIEGRNHDVRIAMDEGQLQLRNKTLAGVLDNLNCGWLVQCSRNYAVNLKKVVSVDNINRYVKLRDGELIDMGGNYRARLKEKLNILD
jgi:DNA-binding LytR/AlgR family response regulator